MTTNQEVIAIAFNKLESLQLGVALRQAWINAHNVTMKAKTAESRKNAEQDRDSFGELIAKIERITEDF